MHKEHRVILSEPNSLSSNYLKAILHISHILYIHSVPAHVQLFVKMVITSMLYYFVKSKAVHDDYATSQVPFVSCWRIAYLIAFFMHFLKWATTWVGVGVMFTLFASIFLHVVHVCVGVCVCGCAYMCAHMCKIITWVQTQEHTDFYGDPRLVWLLVYVGLHA